MSSDLSQVEELIATAVRENTDKQSASVFITRAILKRLGKAGFLVVPREATEEIPWGMQKGEWTWRSYTDGDNDGKTAILIGPLQRRGGFQSVLYLDWADYDGRPAVGRGDAEAYAKLICAGVNARRQTITACIKCSAQHSNSGYYCDPCFSEHEAMLAASTHKQGEGE